MSCMKQNGANKQINPYDIYACKIAVNMMHEKEDHETKSVEKCTQINDCPNQKETIDKDINEFLYQRKINMKLIAKRHSLIW